MEYLGYGCVMPALALAALVLAVLWLAVLWLVGRVRGWHTDRRFRTWRIGRPPPARCLHCHGRGWIERHERALTFTDEGFAETDLPSTMCTACGGTGRRDPR